MVEYPFAAGSASVLPEAYRSLTVFDNKARQKDGLFKDDGNRLFSGSPCLFPLDAAVKSWGPLKES